jgi:ribosomal protein S20
MTRSPMRTYCKDCQKAVGTYHDVIEKVKKFYCEICRKLVREILPIDEE